MGEQLRLREATKEDTPLIVRWRNNPEVMKYFFFRIPFTEAGHNAWREANILTGRTKQFIICLQKTDERFGVQNEVPIGSCTLQNIGNGEAEYGYLIGEDGMRGKGYGTEATRLATDYARDILHLNCLTARVIADNAASLRSFEKAGFTVEKEAPEELQPDGGTVTAVHLRKVL